MSDTSREKRSASKPARRSRRKPKGGARQPPPEQKRPVGAAAPTGQVSRRERLTLAAILLLIYAVAGTWGQFDFSDMMGYYDMFAVALMQGQLHLTVTPDQVNLLDMIPYEGKYHFNWGPFPVIFHWAALVVGADLSDRFMTLIASWLAALVFLEIVLCLRRRFFPELTKPFCCWSFFAFALATPAALAAWRGTINNESISIATLGYLVAFYGFLRYQESSQPRWAFLAGLAMGCALLTRITVTLHAVGLGLGLLAVFWRKRPPLGRIAGHLVAFCLPVILCGLLMMAFNGARFGSPFDFGNRYKPEHTPGYPAFSLARIPESFRHYMLALPQITRDFPWLEHVGWTPVEKVRRAEASSSLLLASPFLVLMPFTWRVLAHRREYSFDFRVATAVAWFNGLLLFFVLLTFGAVSRRYAQDFLPMWMVLCVVGMAVQRNADGLWRKGWTAAWLVVALSALLHLQIAFYQSFRTPTSDINALRMFVALAPHVRRIAPGPELDREAAMAGNDLATLYMRQGRPREALAELRRAAALLPENSVIRENLRRAEALAGAR